MAGQLTTRTSGDSVEKAWAVTEDCYNCHEELYDLSIKAHTALAIRVMQAWKVRENVLRERNGFLPPPAFITRLESQVGAYGLKYSTPSTETSGLTDHHMDFDSSKTEADDDTEPWDSMLGFIDVGSVNWNTIPGEWQPQIPTYAGLGHSVEGYNSNWM